MRIGIDLDNVVVNTTESVIEYLNERVPNLNLTLEDCKQYWLEKNLPHGYELLVQEAFESKHMWKKVKVIKEAKKYINKLRSEGHEIYFVTSSLPENLRKKSSILKESWISSSRVIFGDTQSIFTRSSFLTLTFLLTTVSTI